MAVVINMILLPFGRAVMKPVKEKDSGLWCIRHGHSADFLPNLDFF